MDKINNQIYCMKCRKRTPNVDKGILKQTEKDTYYIQTACDICDAKKNLFIKSDRVPDNIKDDPQLKQGGFIFDIIKLIKEFV